MSIFLRPFDCLSAFMPQSAETNINLRSVWGVRILAHNRAPIFLALTLGCGRVPVSGLFECRRIWSCLVLLKQTDFQSWRKKPAHPLLLQLTAPQVKATHSPAVRIPVAIDMTPSRAAGSRAL